MAAPVYIGDEVTAAGFRLAGLETHVPQGEGLAETVRGVCTRASLVLLSAAVAARLPQALLDELLAGVRPPVVVVPDVRGQVAMQDLATRLRRQLGVSEPAGGGGEEPAGTL